MTTQRPPLTPFEHVVRAKECLTTDADPKYAIAHALTAIAETAIDVAYAQQLGKDFL